MEDPSGRSGEKSFTIGFDHWDVAPEKHIGDII